MEEIKRLQAVLATLDPVKEAQDYERVLIMLHSLALLQKKLLKNDRIYLGNAKLTDWIEGDEEEPDCDREDSPAVDTDDLLPTEALPAILPDGEPDAAPETAESVEAEDAAEPEAETEQPVQEKAPVENVKLPTMTEVRGALAAARRKGTNVTAIIQSFGVDNFKDIPKEKYPEILQKLEG